MNAPIIDELQSSAKFIEGYNHTATGCHCDKCKISRYRHTHEPDLAGAYGKSGGVEWKSNGFNDYLKIAP